MPVEMWVSCDEGDDIGLKDLGVTRPGPEAPSDISRTKRELTSEGDDIISRSSPLRSLFTRSSPVSHRLFNVMKESPAIP